MVACATQSRWQGSSASCFRPCFGQSFYRPTLAAAWLKPNPRRKGASESATHSCGGGQLHCKASRVRRLGPAGSKRSAGVRQFCQCCRGQCSAACVQSFHNRPAKDDRWPLHRCLECQGRSGRHLTDPAWSSRAGCRLLAKTARDWRSAGCGRRIGC